MITILFVILALLLNTIAAVTIVVLYQRWQSSQRNVAQLTQLNSQANQALLDLIAENIRLRRRPMILNSRFYHAYRIDPASIHRN